MISNPDFEKVDGLVEWLREVPYEVLRHGRLYNAEELYQGYEPSVDVVKDRVSFADCYDSRVYQHFIKQGKIARDINESVARSMHDHGIHTALIEFLKTHDPLRCIGIMGGHALLRTDPMFASVAMLSKRLTEAGFFMVSGGGPGAMEATHLGAWLAGRTDEEAQEAIRTLAAAAASFKDGEQCSRRHHPDHRLWRHHLHARQCWYPAGDFPECGAEPLPVVRNSQSDDIYGQGFLDRRRSCLSDDSSDGGKREVQEPAIDTYRRPL